MILTIIDNIPLYSTVREAVEWGRRNNIQGYHTHRHNRRIGYMAGSNHSVFNNTNSNTTPTTLTNNIVRPLPTVATSVSTTPNTNVNTGGGGGY
tara:strand:+ start:357 stop:638 length:282 start_codon:yes stop_codon:yes gene_type:complete